MMGAAMPYTRNAEIYGENEPADYLYKVMTGAVRGLAGLLMSRTSSASTARRSGSKPPMNTRSQPKRS